MDRNPPASAAHTSSIPDQERFLTLQSNEVTDAEPML